MKKPIAIIQARWGATRLPGKVLKRVCGKTLLEHQITRVRRAKELGGIIVATTKEKRDDGIARLVKKMNIPCFRGIEDDVLDRYYEAARNFQIKEIVRITGDCPLIDPAIIDLVLRFYRRSKKKFDYLSNVRPPTFPDGMDVEVFPFPVLEEAWKKATLPSEREHVSSYIANHPQHFRLGNVADKKDFSYLRLTVDEPRDLLLVRKIFHFLYPAKPQFTLGDILHLLEKRPDIVLLNAGIMRNEGYLKSLEQDKI